jgi:hypothetical protein
VTGGERSGVVASSAEAGDESHLITKRSVIGQITVCAGCCCGNVAAGRPAVPVDWLKQEWRRQGLLKRVQLTVSGCVGPCDVPNVVVVTGAAGTQWLGAITELSQYQELLAWAGRSRDEGVILPLPPDFRRHMLCPFSASQPRTREDLFEHRSAGG